MSQEWIYLSPHLDDAILSCGGMIWEQTSQGDRVEVWTIFTADAQYPLSEYAVGLHQRWQVGMNASAVRRAEDLSACGVVRAAARHLDLPDVIYRRSEKDGQPIVREDADLFLPGKLREPAMETRLDEVIQSIPRESQLVSPIGLGNHVDHVLTRAAADRSGRRLLYYEDYPYVARGGQAQPKQEWLYHAVPFVVTPEGLAAWQKAVTMYESQISTFWNGESEMRKDLQAFWQRDGGQRLWKAGT